MIIIHLGYHGYRIVTLRNHDNSIITLIDALHCNAATRGHLNNDDYLAVNSGRVDVSTHIYLLQSFQRGF